MEDRLVALEAIRYLLRPDQRVWVEDSVVALEAKGRAILLGHDQGSSRMGRVVRI